MLILSALATQAQTINLRGTVSNPGGQPISGATVTLQNAGLSKMTGSDGTYVISQDLSPVLPSLVTPGKNISLNRDVLEFHLAWPTPISIEIFDISGTLLKKELIPGATPGTYRSDILKSLNPSQPHMVRATVGEEVETFRYFPSAGEEDISVESLGEHTLGREAAKRAAVVDTLVASASGYQTKTMPLESYDQEIDITLETSGGSMGRSAGCGSAPSLSTGKRSLQVGGDNRSYIINIPENYDRDTPHRLVFAFHWNGGTSEDIDGGGSSGYTWSYYGLREQSDDENLPTIYVAPQGISNGWGNSGGRDLNFVDAMLDLFQEDLCIDTERIFSMGFSYGGGMSYAIACDRADVFRAVAIYGGAVLSGCGDGSKPVAYLGIHGISDGTCRIENARPMRDRFVDNNGCTPQNAPEPSPGSRTHTCTVYDGCNEGYPVEWCAFDGGHTPGHVEGGGDDGAKTWTKGEAYKFFKQF